MWKIYLISSLNDIFCVFTLLLSLFLDNYTLDYAYGSIDLSFCKLYVLQIYVIDQLVKFFKLD